MNLEHYLNKCGSGFIVQTLHDNVEDIHEFGYASLKPEKIKLDRTFLFDIASLTKTLTAICFYKLVEEGKIDLNTKISSIEPKFINLTEISILDLLSHRIGLWTDGYLGDAKSKEEWNNILYNSYIQSKIPIYTDSHYIILSNILECICQDNYYNILNEYIFKPLNITSATYYPEGNTVSNDYWFDDSNIIRCPIKTIHDTKARVGLSLGIYTGHAGVFMNINDFMIILKSLLNHEILNEDTISIMNKYDDLSKMQYQTMVDIATKNNRDVVSDFSNQYKNIEDLSFPTLSSFDYTYGGMRHHSKIKQINDAPYNSSATTVFFSGFTRTAFTIDFEKKIIILVMGNLHCVELSRKQRAEITRKMFNEIYDYLIATN